MGPFNFQHTRHNYSRKDQRKCLCWFSKVAWEIPAILWNWRRWSDVMDYAANFLEICGSLIQLFEFQRPEVMSLRMHIREN